MSVGLWVMVSGATIARRGQNARSLAGGAPRCGHDKICYLLEPARAARAKQQVRDPLRACRSGAAKPEHVVVSGGRPPLHPPPIHQSMGRAGGGREDRRKRGVLFLCIGIGLESRPGASVGGSVHWDRAKPEHVVVSGGRHPLHPPPIRRPSVHRHPTATGPAGGGGEDKRKKGRPHIGICTQWQITQAPQKWCHQHEGPP
eukprot:scaffold555_cov109-Isochrysis_galbana.AAC.14